MFCWQDDAFIRCWYFKNSHIFYTSLHSFSFQSSKMLIIDVITLFIFRQIKHYQEFIFWERPRDVMPSLIDLTDPKIKFVNSFFVDRHKDLDMIPSGSAQKAKPYMMQSRHYDARSRISRLTGSRRNSQTESSISEQYHTFYPEELRVQIEALDKLNRTGSILYKT